MTTQNLALVSQEIDESGPGSILVDFEALLGFIENPIRLRGGLAI